MPFAGVTGELVELANDRVRRCCPGVVDAERLDVGGAVVDELQRPALGRVGRGVQRGRQPRVVGEVDPDLLDAAASAVTAHAVAEDELARLLVALVRAPGAGTGLHLVAHLPVPPFCGSPTSRW